MTPVIAYSSKHFPHLGVRGRESMASVVPAPYLSFVAGSVPQFVGSPKPKGGVKMRRNRLSPRSPPGAMYACSEDSAA